ncbi:hypothetical protein J0936_000775 [Listeria monocytogenes]|nr:hypothetical protein [Listeria monocytogenes]EHF2865411.1 hypothetical protein [Listeria monocytogenes]
MTTFKPRNILSWRSGLPYDNTRFSIGRPPAGGKFKNVELDATITNIAESDRNRASFYSEILNYIVISIYHNQNVIAQANCRADNGNSGHYYSVCSLVVKDVHYKVVEA